MNLKNFYGCLALLSTLAAAQSIVFPRWPQASKIPPEKINNFKANVSANGKEIRSLPTLAAYSTYNVSSSPITRLMIGPSSNLFLTNVQVRDRKNMEVSYITETLKSLQLSKSANTSRQAPIFLTEVNPEGSSFQTCLVPNSTLSYKVEVNQDQLSSAVDSLSSNTQNLAIRRFLGLSPSRRYECMLITLKTTLASQEGSKLWIDLLYRLQQTFT